MLVGLLLTLSIIVFLWACLGLLAPGLAGLSARWQSVLVWAVAVGLLFTGIEMGQPPPPQVITAEQRDRNVERQRQQRAEELGISVSEVIEMEARDRAAAAERQQAERRRVEEERRQRAARARRERDGSMARQRAARIRGELDDPIGPILAQMSMTAQRGRMGEDRTFTYVFADGSRLILVARPQGGGRGLALRYVDIED